MARHILVRTNPDGTKEEIYSGTSETACRIHQMSREGLNEKLEVITQPADDDVQMDYKKLADGWRFKALKHIETLYAVAELVKCNQASGKWFYDLTQLLIDAGYIKENETEYGHKDAIKNNVI